MPTASSTDFWGSGTRVVPYRNPEEAEASVSDVRIAASTTLAAGTILGRVTATGRYAAYNDANTDGTQRAEGVLKYSVVTDASGNITNASEWGLTTYTQMYEQGDFLAADLTGLDAAAVADLEATYKSGTTVLHIP